MNRSIDNYDKIIQLLDLKQFSLPLIQDQIEYFPSFIEAKLNNLIRYYEEKMSIYLKEHYRYNQSIISSAQTLQKILNETIELYYQGRIHDAYTCFAGGLDSIDFNSGTIPLNIYANKNNNFYRGRSGERGIRFSEKDLFHVPFELRFMVSSNRFSVPGLPALYLCDSLYACWEELSQKNFSEIWFSRISNVENLKVVQIHRLEDLCHLIASEQHYTEDDKLLILNAFLTTFPIIMASSVGVKEKSGHFKPEYIIPQMLAQYVAKSKNIDGIKFLSTNIDYTRLENTKAYNYVFPVKHINPTGFCPNLKKIFHMTSPSTLEFEEMLRSKITSIQSIPFGKDTSYIELIDGERVNYDLTVFRKMEAILLRRPLKVIL